MPEAALKKIILGFITSLLTVLTLLNAAEPENFIPDQSQQLMRLNANSIVKMPWLKKWLNMADEKCRETFLVLDELQKSGIAPTMVFAGELWAAKIGKSDKAGVILIKTALPEAKFAEFFKEQQNKNKNVDLSITTLAGQTVYIGKYAPGYKASSAEPFAVFYLAADVLGIMPFTDESGILLTALKQGGNNVWVKNIDKKSLCAIIFNDSNRKAKIRSTTARINLAGPQQKDIEAEAVLICKNAKTAMRKAMEMQFIVPSFAGLLFGNDQKLLESLTAGFSAVPYQEKITIKINLPETLQNKIAGYLADPANVSKLDIEALSSQF